LAHARLLNLVVPGWLMSPKIQELNFGHLFIFLQEPVEIVVHSYYVMNITDSSRWPGRGIVF